MTGKRVMTRRDFCAGVSSLFGALWLGGCRSVLTSAPGEDSSGDIARRLNAYRVAVLGDTHFDKAPESVYHSHYDESNKWAKVQHEEFRRNGDMWQERCPSLVAASAALAAKHDTAFILQLGDLIQGDCDHAPTHRQMLDDAISAIRDPYPPSLPFLTVVGNHDIRGKGAKEEYKSFIKWFMFAETMRLDADDLAVKSGVSSFFYRGDKWIFCNFETKDLQSIIDAVEESGDARHVFLVTHGPFVTPDSRSCRWRLGGRECCDALRPKLYEALSRRHAIVLAGHIHTTAFCRIENEFGSFSEMTFNSVWAKPSLATGEAMYDKPEHYGANTLAVLKGDKLDDFKAQLALFRPALKEYFYSLAAGHYGLEISDTGVKADFYPGAATIPARTFTLA